MKASGTAPLHYYSSGLSCFPQWCGHYMKHFFSFVLRHSEKQGRPFQQHSRERLCVNERWFQGLGSFPLHVRPFLCSSTNAARCLNGRCSPSCNTRAPTGICSIQLPDGSEREEEWKWQRKALRQADKVHACESCCPLTGLQKCWGFSSTLHQWGDSIRQLMSLQKCIYRWAAKLRQFTCF